MDKDLTIKIVAGSKNWGDAANLEFVKTITGQYPQTISIHDRCDDPLNPAYLLIGSILGFADNNSIVWGSGFIFDGEEPRGGAPKKICAVRGPLSRKKLLEQNIDCPQIYGDPVLLFPRFYQFDVEKKYELGIVPHFIDKDSTWLKKISDPSIKIIDIEGSFDQVIKDILSCKKIASSSLHGVILADAYGIPSIWIELSDKVLGKGFKFEDYFLSVGRKDKDPLVVNENTSIEDLYQHFTDYKINIDLDALWESCPIR